MAQTNLGIVAPVPRGDWNSTTTYQKLNIVRYNGASYMAKNTAYNIEPTINPNWGNYWVLLVQDGAQGSGGSGVSDYDLLTDKPIINQDLTASGFTPITNTYYRHTGTTTITYTQGVIYYYNGTEYKVIDGSSSGSGGTTNYNDLSNKPIQRVNLINFIGGVENTYYQHIGETDDNFTSGKIYFYDGENFIPVDGRCSVLLIDSSFPESISLSTFNLIVDSAFTPFGEFTPTYITNGDDIFGTVLSVSISSPSYREVLVDGVVYKYTFDNETATITTTKTEIGGSSVEIEEDKFSNALKGYASGTAIGLKDVSPIPSNIEVKVSGVDNPSTVTISRYGKNLMPFPYLFGGVGTASTNLGVTFTVQEDCGIRVEGTPTEAALVVLYTGVPLAMTGKLYISLQGSFTNLCIQTTIRVKSTDVYIVNTTSTTEGEVDLTSVLSGYTADELEMLISLKRHRDGIKVSGVVYPQLEVGTKTSYEKYIAPTTFTPDSNGNLEIPPLIPATTLLTDNTSANLSVVYNRDINAAINGTTETQPLATVQYVDNAVASAKTYTHIFNGSWANATSTDFVDYCVAISSPVETKLIDNTQTDQEKLQVFNNLLFDLYGATQPIPNISGFVSSPSTSPVVDMRVDTDKKLQFLYINDNGGISFIIADDVNGYFLITERVIEI